MVNVDVLDSRNQFMVVSLHPESGRNTCVRHYTILILNLNESPHNQCLLYKNNLMMFWNAYDAGIVVHTKKKFKVCW